MINTKTLKNLIRIEKVKRDIRFYKWMFDEVTNTIGDAIHVLTEKTEVIEMEKVDGTWRRKEK